MLLNTIADSKHIFPKAIKRIMRQFRSFVKPLILEVFALEDKNVLYWASGIATTCYQPAKMLFCNEKCPLCLFSAKSRRAYPLFGIFLVVKLLYYAANDTILLISLSLSSLAIEMAEASIIRRLMDIPILTLFFPRTLWSSRSR